MLIGLLHIKLIIALIVHLFLLSAILLSQEPLIFGGVEAVPPLSYSENGVNYGFFVDVTEEISRRIDREIIIRLYPFPRLLQYLKDGQVDGVISIYHQIAREEYILYSREPVLISRVLIFSLKKNNLNYTSVDSMLGGNFGVMSGWALLNQDLEKAVSEGLITLTPGRHMAQNLKVLLAGRVDGLILSEQATWYHAALLGIREQLKINDFVIAINRTYLGSSRNSQKINPTILIKQINTALDDIYSDGTHQLILEKNNMISMHRDSQP